MIFDSINNAEIYFGLGEKFKLAFDFINNSNFAAIETGKHPIDGENVFALVQKYITKDESDCRWEAHRKYIDLQFVAYGSEAIGFVNSDYLDPKTNYDSKTDVRFFEGDGDFIQVNDNEFVILFPHDAHMPGVKLEECEEVLKVVIKIAV